MIYQKQNKGYSVEIALGYDKREASLLELKVQKREYSLGIWLRLGLPWRQLEKLPVRLSTPS